jgi:hypothetical protein
MLCDRRDARRKDLGRRDPNHNNPLHQIQTNPRVPRSQRRHAQWAARGARWQGEDKASGALAAEVRAGACQAWQERADGRDGDYKAHGGRAGYAVRTVDSGRAMGGARAAHGGGSDGKEKSDLNTPRVI